MSIDAKDLDGGVRLLTMNRPPANAISKEFNDGLFEQCKRAREDDGVRAVVVTGIGRFFSAGLDIKEAAAGTSRVSNLVGHEEDGVFALWTMPKPTVAMINGHTIAGGIIIALACDFRITQGGNHRFGLNEIAIGLPIPLGAIEVARLALGSKGLRYGVFEGSLCGPERAMELGFVDEVVAPEELEPRCLGLARELASHGILAYGHVKREVQKDAVQRVLTQTREDLKRLTDVAASEESRTLLAAQAKSISHH